MRRILFKVPRGAIKIDLPSWSTWVTSSSNWQEKGHMRDNQSGNFTFSRRKGINGSSEKVESKGNDAIWSVSRSVRWERSGNVPCVATWWNNDVPTSDSSRRFQGNSGTEVGSWRPKIWHRVCPAYDLHKFSTLGLESRNPRNPSKGNIMPY